MYIDMVLTMAGLSFSLEESRGASRTHAVVLTAVSHSVCAFVLILEVASNTEITICAEEIHSPRSVHFFTSRISNRLRLFFNKRSIIVVFAFSMVDDSHSINSFVRNALDCCSLLHCFNSFDVSDRRSC